MKITTAFVAATLASVLVAEAQPSAAVETAWSRVQLGDTVIVSAKDSREIRGKYEHVVDGRLTLRVDGQVREVLLADIQQVAKLGDSSRNGFLIGAALGATGGLLMPYRPCPFPPCPSISPGERIGSGAIAGLVFGGMGALTGRVIPGRIVVFRSGPKAAAVSISPSVLPQQRGVRISVSFD